VYAQSVSNKVVFNVTLKRGAVIIGVVLLMVCLAAPLYAGADVRVLAQMITGFYGLLFVLLGVAGKEKRKQGAGGA